MAKDSKTRSLQTKTKVQEKKNQILTANGKRLENLTPADNGKSLENQNPTDNGQNFRENQNPTGFEKRIENQTLTEIVIGQKTKPLQTMAKGQKTQPLQKMTKVFFKIRPLQTIAKSMKTRHIDLTKFKLRRIFLLFPRRINKSLSIYRSQELILMFLLNSLLLMRLGHRISCQIYLKSYLP